MSAGEFHTLKGYQMHRQTPLTASGEDYLEMMMRLSAGEDRIRVRDLARALHVKPSSVSKMLSHLGEEGYVAAPRYGEIRLTGKGQEEGAYLLYRHDILHRFLRYVNHSEDELEQVEKIEHFIDRRTVRNLAALLETLTK